MNSLRPFIERALGLRRARIPELLRLRDDLAAFVTRMDRLRGLATEAAHGAGTPPDFKSRAALLKSQIPGLDGPIEELRHRLANLAERFGKNAITVGVAGKARQGKSTILQAITGLGNDEIPAHDGEPCTGAKSRIVHRDGSAGAEIEFFESSEFLRDIVHSYYSDLKLSPPPSSMEEFARSLPARNPSALPDDVALYARLARVHAGLGEFRHLLSQPPKAVALKEVKEYVLQLDPASDEPRNRYLAVRCANVFAPFPNGDVTGLAIVDLPGLGEIAKGHGEKLVHSLQREVDAIVLVRLPSEMGDFWSAADIEVFGLVKRALPELDLADWLFVVLNRKADGINSKIVESMKNRPPHIGSSPRLLAVNCLDPEAVRRDVFLEVLGHLERNLERLDRRQVEGLRSAAREIAGRLGGYLEPFDDFFGTDRTGADDFLKFGELFKAFMTRLRTNLDLLTDDYRRRIEGSQLAGEFRQALEEACQLARASVPIPTPETLMGLYYNAGGWAAALTPELHHLRSYLTHNLAEHLDRRLAAMIDEVRRQIVVRLMAEPLDRIVPTEGEGGVNADPIDRLKAFRTVLDPAAHPMLSSGLGYLDSFSSPTRAISTTASAGR